MFYALLKRYPFIKQSMQDNMKSNYNDKWKKFMKRALRNIDYFYYGVSDSIIEEITFVLEPIDIKEGDFFINAGTPCKHIYIVVQGELDTYIYNNGKEFYIDTLYSGCNIGSYSMINNANYTFSVKARSDCSLLKLSTNKLLDLRDSFEELDDTVAEYEEYLRENGMPY